MNKNNKELAIEMKNITMVFGTFKALDGVNLSIKKGEVHALIGENGAGKSTLMSVLFGLYKQTSGNIYINDEIVNIDSPNIANDLGIGMVHQHFKLVETFTAFENIILTEEKTKVGILSNKDARKKIESLMKKFHFEVDLDKLVSKCSVAEQQRIEILKMLFKDADILIFDEPTAVLTPKQIDGFLDALKDLNKKGKTIILISHKLDELKKVANRGTIIRRGKYIDTIDIKKATQSKIGELMVGKKVATQANTHKNEAGEVVLSIEDLTVNKVSQSKVVGLENFNLQIRKGEIVAIAGVEGNGQSEIINAITGMSKIKSGKILLTRHLTEKEIAKAEKNSGEEAIDEFITEDISKDSILSRYNKGIAHIPEDRHKHGVVLDMNQIENFILQDHRKNEYSKFGFININNAKINASKSEKKFDVRSSQGISSKLRGLSGGNQQKFIVGRELSKAEARLIVVAQPTRGLDVGAINNIHKYILEARDKGAAILLISYELDEVINLADRIVVMNSGLKVGEIPGKGATRVKLGSMMASKAKKKGIK